LRLDCIPACKGFVVVTVGLTLDDERKA